MVCAEYNNIEPRKAVCRCLDCGWQQHLYHGSSIYIMQFQPVPCPWALEGKTKFSTIFTKKGTHRPKHLFSLQLRLHNQEYFSSATFTNNTSLQLPLHNHRITQLIKAVAKKKSDVSKWNLKPAFALIRMTMPNYHTLLSPDLNHYTPHNINF